MLHFLKSRFLPLAVLGIFAALVLLWTFLSPALPTEHPGIFGKVTLKAAPAPTKKTMSNYQKNRAKRPIRKSLRYKIQKTVTNPFFSFYRAEKTPQKLAASKPKRSAKRSETGFYSTKNTNKPATQSFFQAVFRQTQNVQDGKALKIVLQEPIPALKLPKGAVLKGVPHLEGNRIGIQITAAVVHEKVKKVSLNCFDKEDCLPGLYHDVVAAYFDRVTQEILQEEMFDTDPPEAVLAQRGRRVAKKLTDILQHTRALRIAAGKEIFVALPTLKP